jgi:hypothetical protein
MSDIQNNSLSTSQDSRESVSSIPQEIQEYIDRDLRLQKLSQDPTQREIILSIFSKNKAILEKSDNLSEHTRLWNESLKEYWQLTKDGREYAKLTEKEVDELSRSEKKEYALWDKSRLNAKLLSTAQLADKEWEKAITEEQRLAENKEKAITEEQRLAENKEKAITTTQLADKEWEKAITTTQLADKEWEKAITEEQKETKNKEAITQKEEELKKIQEKLPKIEKAVNAITSIKGFSVGDKSRLSTSLKQAKSGQSDNAAVEELKKQGVQESDIKSGKYDNYISASIIIEQAGQFDAYKSNPDAFKNSLKELQSLWIPVRVKPDFWSVTDHISERFASGDRANTAIASIRSGLMNKEFNGVHYDGIGEKYTLIGADGKTRKDIYMDKPPRAEIRLGGLSIGREVPNATPEDLQRQSIQNSYAKNYEKIGKLDINPVASEVPGENEKISSLYKTITDIWLPSQDRITAIWDLKSLNSSRKDANFKKMIDENIDPEPLNSELEEEVRTLDTLESLYREEGSLLEKAKTIPAPTIDTFDNDAKKTLKYLNYLGYDEIGQDVLDKVIESINFHKKWYLAEINLSKNPRLDTDQEKELLRVLAQISRKSGIMTSWQWVNPDNTTKAVEQMNSPNWRLSLQDISKSIRFQEMKWSNRDVFTQYLYEQPKTETESTPPTEKK